MIARSALALALLIAMPAAAQEEVVATEAPASPVDVRLAQGEVLFQAGNYEAALAEFEAAYDELSSESDRYLLLFNVGQCEERLFHYDRAITAYQRYLAEGGESAEGAADVHASIRALEGLLGTVTITVNVTNATVWIDGREVGDAPGDLRVPGGPHTIEVRAAGHASSARDVTIAAHEHVQLRIELAEVSSFEGMDPIVFGVVTGAAAAVLLAGAGTGIAALVMHDHAVSEPNPRLRPLADQQAIANVALAADALWIAGATLGIAAIALAALTDWDGHPEPSAAHVRVVPGPGSVLVTGAF